MGASPIALCNSCKYGTLPRLAQPSWHREKHRASKEEREPEPSTAAQKVIRKNEKRDTAEITRKQVRALGMLKTARLFLSLRGKPPMVDVPSEDCERCLSMQKRGAE